MPRGRKKSPEQRQAQILHAAKTLFASQGFERTTIKEIARAADIAEGTIYLYFVNKQEVLFALVKGEMIDPLAGLLAELQDADDAAIIKTFIRAHFENTDRNRELILIMFSEMHHFSTQMLDDYYRSLVRPALQSMEQYITRRITAGAFRQVNPSIIVRSLLAALRFHLIAEDMLGERVERIPREEMIDEIATLFLRGLQKNPGVSS